VTFTPALPVEDDGSLITRNSCSWERLAVKLNHLDLQVADVQNTTSLFGTLFDLRLQSNPKSTAIAILSDDAGFVLVLQRKQVADESYPSGFHLGFLVDSVETVRSVHARAANLQLEVSEVMHNNRGTMIYCRMPDGYLVEVSCRPLSMSRQASINL
jgi:catechol-2,3-dioxygenase